MLKKTFAALICMTLLSGGQAMAADDDQSAVEIKVDVTDTNASVAREKALNSATRAAVTAVAKRISTTDGAARIASMTDPQLLNFIKETSVISEKNSDVRYMADLKVVVNEELLREYMLERDIPLLGHQAQSSSSILIVPLFREFESDAPMLWEVDNPWKKAWDNVSSSDGIKFVSVPNSAGNMNALSAAQAAEGNVDSLNTVLELSGADNIYVLDAVYDGVEGLNITAVPLSGDKITFKVAGARSSGDVLFNQAVAESCIRIEQQIMENRSDDTNESELTVLYQFPSLEYWIAAEKAIKSLNGVSGIDVQAMSPGKTQFKVRYTGNIEDIQNGLSAQGYDLSDSGSYMILSNNGD